MKFSIDKDQFASTLAIASRFTSNRVASATSLQGVLLKGESTGLRMYATNLNTYFSTVLPIELGETFEVVIEPKKILEFLNFLPAGDVTVDMKMRNITIAMKKSKGNFPFMSAQDFPLPPGFDKKPVKIDHDLLVKELPLVLFASSTDDTRPVLTGVNFVVSEKELLFACTDGFRLSVLREKKILDIPSMIVPADFLQEVLRYVKDAKHVAFGYLEDEKMVRFDADGYSFYSRLIEGDYPPFERVIPSERVSTVAVERAEMLRAIKLISVFARDFSNVVVCDFTPEGITLRPKKEGNEENNAFVEATFDGEPMSIAFNYKFVLDMLNNLPGKTISIELLRPDAPAVFKTEENENFLHVIMPVRVTE